LLFYGRRQVFKGKYGILKKDNLQCRSDVQWGEEGKKSFVYLRSVCPSFSLALDVEKKRLELKFSEKKVVPWQVAAVAVFKKNFK
jgi:hypothetical protein